MKVAIAIPDPVYVEAELLAKRMELSRSEVYARSLDAFVAAHLPDRVTRAMNDVVSEVGAKVDAFVWEAARRVFVRTEW